MTIQFDQNGHAFSDGFLTEYGYDPATGLSTGSYEAQIVTGFGLPGNYQTAGDYALNSALAAEVERAEAAEATLVAKQDFSGNLTNWGYCRLPSGLILQWGNVGGYNPVPTLVETAPINGACSFPVTFSKKCFSLCAGNTSTQGGAADAAFGYPLNNSQFYAQTWAGHLS